MRFGCSLVGMVHFSFHSPFWFKDRKGLFLWLLSVYFPLGLSRLITLFLLVLLPTPPVFPGVLVLVDWTHPQCRIKGVDCLHILLWCELSVHLSISWFIGLQTIVDTALIFIWCIHSQTEREIAGEIVG